MTTLIPVFGDQLSPGIASLRGVDRRKAIVLMAEVWDETTHIKHHKKKLVLVLSAMRHFAASLREAGWTVDYVELEADGNTGSLTGELDRAIARHAPERIRVVEPSEWRVEQAVLGWEARLGLPVEIVEDDRFLASRAEFKAWAAARKSLTMEYFYREMRRSTGLLMDGDQPAGGRWNYDAENRKPAPRGLNFPAPARFAPDETTRAVMALVARRFADHFGDLEPFGFPVTRAQALESLDHFTAVSLPSFGDYQDAMVAGQELLYHSLLSPLLNSGLLTPREVCDAAQAAYDRGEAPLNAVEGFIRQIIGWREYVRGLYWLDMPAFRDANALGATRPLPEFYWTGETDMRCLSKCVTQTKHEAYAHHIQRLMVLGNFAMLAGVDPQAIDDWFYVVYADAFQWAELPNVIGMSQFADGGRLGSKPYAGGGAYIDRMSDYCGRCRYDVKRKTGPDACPFNALFWDFLARNRATIGGNRRLSNMYRNWDRLAPERQAEYRTSAAAFLATLEPAAAGWAR